MQSGSSSKVDLMFGEWYKGSRVEGDALQDFA